MCLFFLGGDFFTDLASYGSILSAKNQVEKMQLTGEQFLER